MNIHKNNMLEHNLENVKHLEHIYKCNYIVKQIKPNTHIQEIIQKIKTLTIDPNDGCYMMQKSNIYHNLISLYSKTNDKYYIKLYLALTKIWPDNNTKNNLNLIPSDYIDKRNLLFM